MTITEYNQYRLIAINTQIQSSQLHLKSFAIKLCINMKFSSIKTKSQLQSKVAFE